MWWKEIALFMFLTIAGFSVANPSDELIFVGQNENLPSGTLDGSLETNTVLLQSEDLEYPPESKPEIKDDGYFQGSDKEVLEERKRNDKSNSYQRVRRQAQTPVTTSLLQAAIQECHGITLRWITGNIPFSSIFHNENPQFSHYNIYRETTYYTSVTGLTPIASGKHIQELRDITTVMWTDKFPPSSTALFYAVTMVDHKGKETQNVTPRQVTFYGSIEKADALNPVGIVPSLLKGDVLHHSVAYNPFRNEYMVAFDLDVNKDGTPDQVYGIRVNGLGQIVERRILNASLGLPTTEQGHPSIAFNQATQRYMIAFQITVPSLFQGKSVIIGQQVHAHTTNRFENPFVLIKVTKDGKNFVSSKKPKLIYNSGSGGFAMSLLLENVQKTALAVFVDGNGKTQTVNPLFKGEVFDVNVFMDTRAQQVYFVFQVAQWAATITSGQAGKKYLHPYIIVAAKANATGAWLTLNDPTSIRHVVGFTNQKYANIAGYLNEKNGWLNVFWNNMVNGKQIISSSTIFGAPGIFVREHDLHTCPTQNNVRNPASCYLPNNNAHVLLWQQGTQIGGHLVRDDTFHPVRGEQQQPQLIYNAREHRVFVAWREKYAGNFVIVVRNIVPGSKFTCTPLCQARQKCAMKNVCAPQNLVLPPQPQCTTNNGECSHICQSNAKGRKCKCPSTHILALDEMKCYLKDEKPDVSFLYSSKGSIWSVSIYYQSKRTSYIKIPIDGKEIISFFYNKNDRYLYWADAGERKIYRALLDGSNKQLLVANQILVPDGMIVDPDAKQLYWTDAALGAIFRSSLDGTNRVSFVSSLDKPRALALHRQNKWLYWSSWGGVAKIERINTDGSNRQLLISTRLVWPNGLALSASELYWADAHHDVIEESDLNGKRRVAITKTNVNHPYGLAIAGSRLFWTDWIGGIRMVDKNQPHDVKDIVKGITKPYSLQVYDGTAVNKASFCLDPGTPTNGGRHPFPNSNGKYNVKDKIVLTCNPGYIHLGANRRDCLATGKWTGTDTRCIALPVFTTRPSNMTKTEGKSAILQCDAENSNGVRSQIKWYKNGKDIKPALDGRYFQTRGKGHLLFQRTIIADTGTYTCAATNEAGEVRASMFLDVKGRKQLYSDCGKPKFKPRAKIIGGSRATPGQIPWQVLLWDKAAQKPFCGGALLNKRWMVTAAHCLRDMAPANVRVILGEHNWQKGEKNEQYFSIEAIEQNTQYNTGTLDSDITLVKFKTDVIMNDYVKPICLPLTKSDRDLLTPGNTGVVSGWGARDISKKGKSVKTLHTVSIPVASLDKCKTAHSAYQVTSNMFCAGDPAGAADACHGDSGGPFTILNKATGRFILTGLVSWGEPDRCGVKGKYGVYTKVQNYLRWIEDRIQL